MMSWLSPCMVDSPINVCTNGCMLDNIVKHFVWLQLRRACINAVHLLIKSSSVWRETSWAGHCFNLMFIRATVHMIWPLGSMEKCE